MAEKKNSPSFDVDTLPLDVFELVDSGMEVESLTAGHGMPAYGASNANHCLNCSCTGSECGGGTLCASCGGGCPDVPL